MKTILILEDGCLEEGTNKSLRLAKLFAAKAAQRTKKQEEASGKIAVLLFDGRDLVDPTKSGKKPLIHHFVSGSGQVNPTDFTKYLAEQINFWGNSEVWVIADMKFGELDEYGLDVCLSLQIKVHQAGGAAPRIEPVVYSRWVDEDKRRTWANRLGITGDRVLQRDSDSEEAVIAVLESAGVFL